MVPTYKSEFRGEDYNGRLYILQNNKRFCDLYENI